MNLPRDPVPIDLQELLK
uniref:Uncharacterized protein n=1 Tax=Arundo donax TaxID=35708 RepID=A0A0A8ZMP9_ARUDO